MRQNAKQFISIKEAIMRRLIDDHKKWYSSRLIAEHLQAELGRNIKPTSYLLQLVRTGHVERAHKPQHLANSKNGQKEYIYRWTGRPYRDNIEVIKQLPYDDLLPVYKAQVMRLLNVHYPNLPSWYQRMML